MRRNKDLELEFLLGCYRRFGTVAGILITALGDKVYGWSQAVDGQLVAVPEFVITLCQSTWRKKKEKSFKINHSTTLNNRVT